MTKEEPMYKTELDLPPGYGLSSVYDREIPYLNGAAIGPPLRTREAVEWCRAHYRESLKDA